MIPRADDYATVYERFRWNVPERYNMAHDACDRHAVDPGRVALVVEGEAGGTREWTFHRIRQLANRCANLLEACGVEPGDRVAILLGQAVETAVVNLACFKCGAVSMPLFTKFGLEDLEFRLADGAARMLVTDIEGFARVAPAVDRLPHLETVLTVDGETDGARDFWRELKRGSVRYQTRATRAEDPAVLLYTSGTTGSPKGVLHAQRILLGHIPGMDFANNYLGQAGDRLWSPADWAWIGGLFDVLMPAWYYGLPVIAAPRPDFDPEQALDILARHAVRNTLLLPTMLKLMAQVPGGRRDVALRSVFTGGEPVGADVMAWAEETLGAAVNEIYGQTECNLVAGGCSMLLERRPGAIGVPIPGHVVDVVDDDGELAGPGGTGHIAVRQPDPVAMLSYWRRPEADAEKVVNGWLLTGDVGHKDEDGFLVVHRAGGRRHHLRRRAVRARGDRGMPDRPRGRGARGRDRGSGPCAGRGGEGVRGGPRGVLGGERTRGRAPRPRPAGPARARGAPGDRVRRDPPAHDDREDHAPRAAAAGGGPAARADARAPAGGRPRPARSPGAPGRERRPGGDGARGPDPQRGLEGKRKRMTRSPRRRTLVASRRQGMNEGIGRKRTPAARMEGRGE